VKPLGDTRPLGAAKGFTTLIQSSHVPSPRHDRAWDLSSEAATAEEASRLRYQVSGAGGGAVFSLATLAHESVAGGSIGVAGLAEGTLLIWELGTGE
jgi:hypothetical protein